MVKENLNSVLGPVLLNPYLGSFIVLAIIPIASQVTGTWKNYKHCFTLHVAFLTKVSIRQSLTFSISVSNLCNPVMCTPSPGHTHSHTHLK